QLLSDTKHFDGIYNGVKALYNRVGNIEISIPELKFNGSSADFLGEEPAFKKIRLNSPQDVINRLSSVTSITDIEDTILGYKGIVSSKRYDGKIWLKAQNETSKFDHAVLAQQMIDEVNSIYPSLLSLTYQPVASLKAGRGVYIVDVSEYSWNKYFNPDNDAYYQQGMLFKRDIKKIIADITSSTRENILDIFARSQGIDNAYDYMNNIAELIPDLSTEHKDLIKEFNLLRETYPDLQVIQINREDIPKYKDVLPKDPTMYKDVFAVYVGGKIFILKDNLLKESKSMLVGSLLHEMVHAPTINLVRRYERLEKLTDHQKSKLEEEGLTIVDPFTDKEREFLTEIDELFKKAGKLTKYSGHNAYSNLEEFVADGITDQSIIDELKIMYDKADKGPVKLSLWERIKLSIRRLFGWDESEKSYHAKLLTSIMDYVYQPRRPSTGVENIEVAKIRDNISVKAGNLNPKHEEMIKALEMMEESYDKLGVRFETAGPMMDRLKIGGLPYELRDEVFQKEYDKYIGIDLNTAHHIDKSFKTVVERIQTKYGISDQAAKDLEKYFNQFKKEGSTIISNLTLVDYEQKLAIKADLIVMDKDNKVHIFKFKTRQNSYDNYDNDRSFSKKGQERYAPFSEYKRDQIELTALKHIFEKVTNTTIGGSFREDSTVPERSGMHIVPLVAVFNEATNTVERYTIDKSFNGKDIIDVDVNGLAALLYINKTKTMDPADHQDITTDDETAEMIKDNKARFDKALGEATKMTPEKEHLLKLIKALDHRLSVTAKSGGFISVRLQTAFINKILREEDVQKALSYSIDEAHKITKDAYDTLQTLKAAGTTISINQLYRFKDAVSAFDILESYQDLLTRKYNIPISLSQEELAALKLKDIASYNLAVLRSKLANAIQWKNAVKTEYEVTGLQALAEVIFPYWTRTRAEYKLRYTKEYRVAKVDGKLTDPTMTEKEYVDSKLNQDGKTIDDIAKDTIVKELKKAGGDISLIARWLDNVLDSPDAVVGSLVKAFVTYDDTARIEIEDERLAALATVNEFTEYTKKFGHNYIKAYEFMLEKDLKTGKYTGNIVSKIHSSLIHEYRSIQQVLDTTLDEDSNDWGEKYMTLWKNTNVPLDKVSYGQAYLNYLDELVKANRITNKEYERLRYEQLKSGKRSKVEEIRKEVGSPLTDNTVVILSKWFQKNVWKYRNPSPEWVNPQYEKLKDILADKNDPRTKMYNMIVDMADRADELVPSGIKLGTRLPGIIKDKFERLSSGQSLTTLVKG
ncbi:MAG: hypothetical protein IMZ59_06145, partial [Actinobacteria bacterium]|nr:hypothetical protein [Actinomycetota bacterium]